MDQLQRESRQVEVIQLRRIEPQVAVLSITKLFGSDTGGGPPPQVDADPTTRQLMVRGTSAQILQIHSLLEKMGEAPAGHEDATAGGSVRTLPLTGRSARLALERIQEIWPTMHGNHIRVVTPNAGIQTMGSKPDDAAGGEPSLSDLLQKSAAGRESTSGPAGAAAPAATEPAVGWRRAEDPLRRRRTAAAGRAAIVQPQPGARRPQAEVGEDHLVSQQPLLPGGAGEDRSGCVSRQSTGR